MDQKQAYDEICAYTLNYGGEDFIHQHVVDAFAAQTARPDGKPIGIFFALVGLCLHVERGFNGREVQRAHMKLAGTKRDWPALDLPLKRGEITSETVFAAEVGPKRDEMIYKWVACVWSEYEDQRDKIINDLRVAKII